MIAHLLLLIVACEDGGSPSEARVAPPVVPPPRPLVERIDPPAGDGSIAPSPTAADDRIVMTWVERIGAGEPARHRVRLATLRNGGWGEPSTVVVGEDLVANWADFPGVVRAGDGTLFAYWMRRTGSERYAYGIELGRSDDGGRTFRPLGPLHDDGTPTEHGFVSAVPLERGMRAFWLDGRETSGGHGAGAQTLRTALVDSTVHDGARLDARVCDCCQTAAVGAADGPLVFYRDRSEGEIRDLAALRVRDGGAAEAVPVAADGWEIAGCPVNGPAAARDGRTVAVAWFTAAGEREAVRVALSTDGGRSFGAPAAVDLERPLGRVDVDIHAGEAVVSWLARGAGEGDAAEAHVRLRRVAADGRLGEPFTVATTTAARASGFPRMAPLDGRLFVAWVEPGPPSRIRAATVDPAALPAPTGRGPGATLAAELGPSPLPPFRARALDGTEVAVSEMRGRPLLLAFFATWCEPCIEELRLLSRVQDEHPGLTVVAVSIDDLPVAEIARFAERQGIRYRVLHDADDAAARVFGVPPLPALFLYDAGGRLVFREVGGTTRTRADLPDAIRRLTGP